jgi:hypothetical protein
MHAVAAQFVLLQDFGRANNGNMKAPSGAKAEKFSLTMAVTQNGFAAGRECALP